MDIGIPTDIRSPDRRDGNYAYYIHPEGDIRISYVNGYGISYGYILIHIRVYFLASITIL